VTGEVTNCRANTIYAATYAAPQTLELAIPGHDVVTQYTKGNFFDTMIGSLSFRTTASTRIKSS